MKITRKQLKRIIREQTQQQIDVWYDAVAQFIWQNLSGSGIDLLANNPEDADEKASLVQALRDIARDIERDNF